MQLQLSTQMRTARKEARARHIQTLLNLGWLEEGGRWRCPRGMNIHYTIGDAIMLEKLRGNIKANGKNWKI